MIVFLSTGRCGTQWLTGTLRELYPAVWVEHEPVGPLYRPRRCFRCYEDPETVLEVPAVARHLEEVERAGGTYVETGWPVFAALPLLARMLPDRLRIVHLTRHPVPTALSHLAHSSYAGSPRDDQYTRLATLGPWDPGVFQPQYAEWWEAMTPYEKCLFWWTEVSLFGLEVPRRLSGIPFLRISSEDLLAGRKGTIERLLGFIGLGRDPRWRARTSQVVDRWHHQAEELADPRLVRRHRLTCWAAAQLGYDAGDLDLSSLHARYQGRPDPGLDRFGRFMDDEGSASRQAVPDRGA